MLRDVLLLAWEKASCHVANCLWRLCGKEPQDTAVAEGPCLTIVEETEA